MAYGIFSVPLYFVAFELPSSAVSSSVGQFRGMRPWRVEVVVQRCKTKNYLILISQNVAYVIHAFARDPLVSTIS
jgi:hypothetical protein